MSLCLGTRNRVLALSTACVALLWARPNAKQSDELTALVTAGAENSWEHAPTGDPRFNPCHNTLVGPQGPYICAGYVTVGIVGYPATRTMEELLDEVDRHSLLVFAIDSPHMRFPMPGMIGECTLLKGLYIAHGIHGTLPSQLGELCQLRALYLFDFAGPVGRLPDLRCLTQLETLELSQLQGAEGDIPQLWNPAMMGFGCDNSGLTGTISGQIGVATKLLSLRVYNNQLNGSLPTQIGLLTQLDDLEMQNNQFSGSIPPEIGRATSLVIFTAFNNRLSGVLPSELNNLTKLQILELYDNSFHGSIPANLSGLVRLERLDLHNNSLSGEVPATIGHLASLLFLDLSQNQLSGTLPRTMVALTRLSALNLGDNQLMGTLAQFVPALVNISVVDTRRNLFEGRVPNGPWTVSCWDSGLENDPCRVVRTCDAGKGELLLQEADAHGEGRKCAHIGFLCIAPVVLLVLFASVLYRSKRVRLGRDAVRPDAGAAASRGGNEGGGIWGSNAKNLLLGVGLAFDVLLLQVGVVQLYHDWPFLVPWVLIAVAEMIWGFVILWRFKDKEKVELWLPEWVFSTLSPRALAVVMREVAKRNFDEYDKVIVEHQVRVSRFKLLFNTVAFLVQIVNAFVNSPKEFVSMLSLSMSFSAMMLSLTMCMVYWTKRECVNSKSHQQPVIVGALQLVYTGPEHPDEQAGR